MSLPSLEIIHANVQTALKEDIGSGDISAALLPELLIIEATIISREPMVMCGQPWATETFYTIDPSIQIDWRVQEGQYLSSQEILCEIKGSARSILTAERTALNFLQTLSGTATITHTYVCQLKHTSTQLLDTRKTIPGLRMAQKYAVTCGGGVNHRLGLYDAFLIKENHIKALGSITLAIREARKLYPNCFLEVEVESIAELKEALQAHPDRILLDNFSVEMMKAAVVINQQHTPLEVSGGVDLEHLEEIAATGVNFISVGAITKHIRAIDLSLLIKGRLT